MINTRRKISPPIFLSLQRPHHQLKNILSIIIDDRHFTLITTLQAQTPMAGLSNNIPQTPRVILRLQNEQRHLTLISQNLPK